MSKVQELIGCSLRDQGFYDPDRIHVEIRWVTARESQQLNHQFREINEPTDVLSFPLYTYQELVAAHNTRLPATEEQSPLLLGTLVLCRAIISERAKVEDVNDDDRLAWTVRHGLKHLLGYDHDEAGEGWQPIVTPQTSPMSYPHRPSQRSLKSTRQSAMLGKEEQLFVDRVCL